MAAPPAPDTDWYVSATTLRTGLTLLRGWSAITKGVVEQLGMEIMPRWCSTSSPLTSGTTKGTSGSMRKYELSSITNAPFCTAMGPNSPLSAVETDMKAMSTPVKLSGVVSSTTSSSPRTLMRLPADLWDAQSFISFRGRSLVSRMLRNSCPTAPVAPTTAMLTGFMVLLSVIVLESYPSLPQGLSGSQLPVRLASRQACSSPDRARRGGGRRSGLPCQIRPHGGRSVRPSSCCAR